MRALVRFAVLALAACGPGIKTYPLDGRQAATLEADPDVPHLLAEHVTSGGVWFPDPACRAQFAAIGPIAPEQHDAFSRCIESLHWQRSARRTRLPDRALLTYGDGLEVEVVLAMDAVPYRIKHVGFVARVLVADAAPTVTQAALELRRLGLVEDPGRDWLWAKVCTDANGIVVRVRPLEASSVAAIATLVDATKRRRFKPYLLGGFATSVCSAVFTGSKPDPTPRVPPVFVNEPEADLIVATDSLGTRISGNILITPSDQDKDQMRRAGLRKLIPLVKLCVGLDGSVTRAGIARVSGLVSYDQWILRNIVEWRYPAQPAPACTYVQFVFTIGDSHVFH